MGNPYHFSMEELAFVFFMQIFSPISSSLLAGYLTT